jgi:pyruvate dehydrogenase E2 component (dihydrolipoamide acetyltransferase)
VAEVQLPQLGESVTEGIITAWLVSPGDTVTVDQPIVEISTDKVDTEIPSPVAGTVAELRASRRHRPGRTGHRRHHRRRQRRTRDPHQQQRQQHPQQHRAAAPAPAAAPAAPRPRIPAARHGPLRHRRCRELTARAPHARRRGRARHAGHRLRTGRARHPCRRRPRARGTRPVDGRLGRLRRSAGEGRAAQPHPTCDRGLDDAVLQTTAQLTSAVEVDVTAIMRLREQHKDAFAAAHDVALSPARDDRTCRRGRAGDHPVLNASIDTRPAPSPTTTT